MQDRPGRNIEKSSRDGNEALTIDLTGSDARVSLGRMIADDYAIRRVTTPSQGGFGMAACKNETSLNDLTLPDEFDHDALRAWVDRIGSLRLRTLVSRRLKELVDGAVATAFPRTNRGSRL